MDPVSLAVGGGLLLAGWVIGRIRRPERHSKVRVPKCPCGHAASFHDPQTRRCHASISLFETRRGEYEASCPCRQYLGPEVLSAQMWMQPTILGPTLPEQRATPDEAG